MITLKRGERTPMVNTFPTHTPKHPITSAYRFTYSERGRKYFLRSFSPFPLADELYLLSVQRRERRADGEIEIERVLLHDEVISSAKLS